MSKGREGPLRFESGGAPSKHEWVSDPPYSERLVCARCGEQTTHCTLRCHEYGGEDHSCKHRVSDLVVNVVDRHGRQVGIVELTLDDGCLHVTVNQLDDTLGPVKTTVL